MTALHRIADDYPFATGSVGGAGAILTWCIERMETLSPILAFVAQILGIGIAVVTLYILCCRVADRAEKRRQHFRDCEPTDEDDDLP